MRFRTDFFLALIACLVLVASACGENEPIWDEPDGALDDVSDIISDRVTVPDEGLEDAIQDTSIEDAIQDTSIEDAAQGTDLSLDCGDFTDLTTFPVVTEKAKTKWDDDEETQRIFYTGGDDGSAYGAYSIIKITAFENLTSYPSESGAVIDLSTVGFNVGDGFLVRIGIDCDDRGHLCSRWFWAYDGEATVTTIDWSVPVGSTFAGSLADVLFREVTLDAAELPILVTDGCSFNLSSFTWDHAVTLAAGDGL